MTPPTPAGPAATILLCFALAVCALSCLGLVIMKGFYNKLHFLAPPAILGTAAIALAVVAKEGLNASAIKVGMVLLVLLISNPILTFAAARAHHVREEHTNRPGSPRKEQDEDKVTPSSSPSMNARKEATGTVIPSPRGRGWPKAG